MNFVFAAEVGMEVPLYNAGLLCEENQVKRHSEPMSYASNVGLLFWNFPKRHDWSFNSMLYLYRKDTQGQLNSFVLKYQLRENECFFFKSVLITYCREQNCQ